MQGGSAPSGTTSISPPMFDRPPQNKEKNTLHFTYGELLRHDAQDKHDSRVTAVVVMASLLFIVTLSLWALFRASG
ncbi:hypothetical protein [Rubritalea tangerina]|uniref:hypothetical protein n=1 Tax=Rubritalea tangerina TaxID=430798 RepID=UPI00361BF31A